MNYLNAKRLAQESANQYGHAVILFSDPISNAEELDGPWGFAPAGGGADLIGKWRDKALDERITPENG